MFDHDHRVAGIDEAVQDLQQLADVVEVQAGGWFVEQIQRLARLRLGQFRGEFHALGFAAGQRRCRLAQREIIESNRGQHRQRAADLGDVIEQLQRLTDRHVQHIGDALTAVLHRQRFGVVALAAADVALDPDIGQEVHFDQLLPVPFARFATAAGPVEAEPRRRVAPDLGFWQA